MASSSAGSSSLLLLVILLGAIYHGLDNLSKGGQAGSNIVGIMDIIIELKGMVEERVHGV
jgi:hypothetical protein